MELLWALAAHGPSVLAEANFRPHDPRQRARLAALDTRPVEVYCRCPADLAAVRTHLRAEVHPAASAAIPAT